MPATKCRKSYSNDSSNEKSIQPQSDPNSSKEPSSNKTETSSSSDPLPACPDPNLCCREGCPNCVWIEYAKEVKMHHNDSDRVVSEIEKQIDDPSIRAFIIMQVKDSLKKKE